MGTWRHTNRRSFVKGATGLGVTVGLAGCIGGNGGDDGGAIKIGSVNHLTGASSSTGAIKELTESTRVEQINDDGGIDGRELEYVSIDGGSDANTVTQAMQDLADQDVVGISSPYGLSFVNSAIPVAARENIPYIIGFGSSRQALLDQSDYVWRALAGASTYVDTTVPFIENELASEIDGRIAITGTPAADGRDIGEIERDRLESAGYDIVFEEYFDAGTSDLTPLVRSIADSDAEVVTWSAGPSDSLQLLRAAREVEFDPTAYIGRYGAIYPEVLEGLGRDTLGIMGTGYWDPNVELPGTEEWLSYWNEYNPDVDPFYLHVISDTTVVSFAEAIRLALEEGQDVIRENVNGQLANVDIEEHPLGGIKFDDRGQNERVQIFIKQYQEVEGEIQQLNVYPEEYATSDWIEHPSWSDK